jgi:diacylglycerol kinase family enzyme
MQPSPVEFDRLIVLVNAKSSRAARVHRRIAELNEAYPGKVVMEYLEDAGTTSKLLQEIKPTPEDIVIPAGGDGTVNTVIQCLLDPKAPKTFRKVRVLPFGTGRMNDVARMLNGRHLANPLYVLRHGHELPIYPLSCVCTPLSGKAAPVQKTSVYSVGFGYSAALSKLYNTAEFRTGQKQRTLMAREKELFRASLEVLQQLPHFDIEQNGVRRSVLEALAVSGHLLGGYCRLPAKLSQEQFFFDMSDNKSFAYTVRTIAELMTNRVSTGQLTTNAEFTLLEPILGHVGGETFEPPAPCHVAITHHKQPLIVIATNPKA